MTTDEKKKFYALLSAPFPEEAIERTDGRITGRGYSTTGIKYQYVVNRLNEVLGLGNWRTHREISIKTFTNAKGRPAFEATCDLVLELGEWIEGKFMPWAEALADGGHTSLSEADARKGSFTGSLKKAAAMFGCGRQAYEGTLDDDNTPADSPTEDIIRVPSDPPQRPQEFRQPAQVTHATQVAPVTIQTQQPAPMATDASGQNSQSMSQPVRSLVAPSRNRLTSKQLAALWAIARKLGHDQSQFRLMVKQREHVQPEFLSREAASKLIGEMSAKLGNGHAAEFERQPGHEG